MKRKFKAPLFYMLLLLTIVIVIPTHYCFDTQAVNTSNLTVICSNGHKYNRWKITREATTTNDGLKTRICLNCGNCETVKMKKLIPISVGTTKITSCSKTYNSIKIYWAKAHNATGYRVYMKENGTWKIIKKIFNGENSFYIGNLQQNKNYEFRVKAFAKNVDGKYSYGATSPSFYAKTSAKVNLKKTNIGYLSLKLNWTKISGMSGYVVKQKINGKWKTLKYLSGSTTSYYITGLKKDTQYELYVGAYKKDSNGKSNYITGAFETVRTLTTQVNIKTKYVKTDSSVKIYWDKISVASGYRVYCYNNGKLISVNNVKTNYYYKGKLEPGNKYRFIVKAYRVYSNKSVRWYENSKVITTFTNLPTAKITSSTKTTSSVKLYWNKTENATGYRVYLKVNEKWTIVKNIFDENARSYYVRGLKSKTKYEFRIRAFSTAMSPIICGGYSGSYFVTTK